MVHRRRSRVPRSARASQQRDNDHDPANYHDHDDNDPANYHDHDDNDRTPNHNDSPACCSGRGQGHIVRRLQPVHRPRDPAPQRHADGRSAGVTARDQRPNPNGPRRDHHLGIRTGRGHLPGAHPRNNRGRSMPVTRGRAVTRRLVVCLAAVTISATSCSDDRSRSSSVTDTETTTTTITRPPQRRRHQRQPPQRRRRPSPGQPPQRRRRHQRQP